MHKSFLKYLMDPDTHKPFTLEIIQSENDIIDEGYLVSGKNRYPIIRGIPRFAGYNSNGDYTKSFSYQWYKWGYIQYESDNKGKPMEGHTLNVWEKVTGISTLLSKKIVVDWGCGSGRFIEISRMKKAKVIGIDLSESVEVVQERFKRDPNVLIIQGDVLHAPIKSDVADVGFSIGVLHHTPDPYKGFQELARVTKHHGVVALSVYGSSGYYVDSVVNIYRQIFKKLWPWFHHYPPLLYAYFTVYCIIPLKNNRLLYYLFLPFFYLFPAVNLKDRRWSVLDTFDSVTPTYQKGLTLYEVFHWFKSCHLTDIEPANWKGTCLIARRP